MRYLERVIQPGEVARQFGRLHWIIFWPSIFLIKLWIAGEVLLFLLADQMTTNEKIAVSMAAAFRVLILAALLLMGPLLRRVSTEIVVTDRRVIYKTGIISRHSREIAVNKIETVDVDQSIPGRIFGYGDVVIRGVGSSWEPLRSVADPIALRNSITLG